MAFSSTYQAKSIAGNLKIEVINFNSASVTTGAITCHMSHILSVHIQNTTSGVVAGQKAAISGQTVTLSGLNSNDVGNITVIGY
jgi:hypothetical protein